MDIRKFFKRPLSSVQATASPSELTDGVVSVILLAESSKNIADCSHPTEFADYSNLIEFVTLAPCDFILLQLQ
ncbi:hypothetical protein AALO_G00186250 [Alosa alosa]|uniref:Uncharacterized protein n=1 Tax=Alosa alosa TaxID=278164 RepID=A0AAV6G502_9TELE|nr:hypothetical protein AALO_G00186250 [Alosa alosa]